MKILLLGDASNYHATLAVGLRALGHDVTVASHGSRWMSTNRDIDISRRPGKMGGALLWLRLNTVLSSQLRGYDVVQLCGPGFVDQKPIRLRKLFDKLRKQNGKVFMTMLGTDSEYVRLADEPILKYNEWQVNGNPTPFALSRQKAKQQWLAPELSNYCRYVYEKVDGVLTALYEYHKICQRFVPSEKLAYGGIPIDASDIVPTSLAKDGPLRIMAACHKGREQEKGFDLMLPILQEFTQENQDSVVLDIVQNVPIQEFQKKLDNAHIVVDQLYSYTPATTALMAMARGKVVISGGDDEYYRFIGESQLSPKPIINPVPDHLSDLKTQLQRLLSNRPLLSEKGAMGPAFVKKHNDVKVVANRFVKFWEGKSHERHTT